MSDDTEDERTEPRRWEYPAWQLPKDGLGNLPAAPATRERIEQHTLEHLRTADLAFIEFLDAWIDKGLADGTLTIEKGARYREAIAARCAELGEVPHVREHIVALQLKAGDVLGIISPSESSAVMGHMARYAREILKVAGTEGVEVLVFPPGTEIRVLQGAAAEVSDEERFRALIADNDRCGAGPEVERLREGLRQYLEQVRKGTQSAAGIRAVLHEEIRNSARYGHGLGHQ